MPVMPAESQALAPQPSQPEPAIGLSAHAQALWLAAVRYRRLADRLADADERAAGR